MAESKVVVRQIHRDELKTVESWTLGEGWSLIE